jgi:hypothetical protein
MSVPSNLPRDRPLVSALAEEHVYRPANPGDARAPCPALNALANHGFLYVFQDKYRHIFPLKSL